VVSSANEQTGEVDLNLLKSFVEQVRLKVSILLTQAQFGLITLKKSKEAVMEDVIYELLTCRPNQIESELTERSQIWSRSQGKMTRLQEVMRDFHSQMQGFQAKFHQKMAQNPS